MRTFALSALALLGLSFASGAHAQEVTVGGHLGALGNSSNSGIAYGAQFGVNPYGFAGLRIDTTWTTLTNGTFFSSSPALTLYPFLSEEFRVGVLAGPGFYRAPGGHYEFGLHGGVTGEFFLNRNVYVGMEARTHHTISETPSNDYWSVLLTAGYKFETGGNW